MPQTFDWLLVGGAGAGLVGFGGGGGDPGAASTPVVMNAATAKSLVKCMLIGVEKLLKVLFEMFEL